MPPARAQQPVAHPVHAAPSQHGTPPRATVASAFVRGMLGPLAHRHGNLGALLDAAGIDPAILDDESARVPLGRYAELYNLTITALADEGFGLFSQPLRPGCFEFLCRSTIGAPDLATALDRAARFLALVLPDMHVQVQRPAGAPQAQLIIQENVTLPVARVFAHEWLLRLLHGLACWLVGRGIALDRVDFPYPQPPHTADYALIYTADSRYGAPRLCAWFAANLLELPVRRDEAALQHFLDGAPGRLTMLYRRDRETVLRVRDCLRNALPESPGLESVARQLNLAPRTLHRRLEEEGASFRTIRDALRRDLALNRVAKSDQALAHIALELGFADPSAFYRAFVAWTGVSPSQYRKRARSGAAT